MELYIIVVVMYISIRLANKLTVPCSAFLLVDVASVHVVCENQH